MTARVGVAISTTGDEHRLGLLSQCVAGWDSIPMHSLYVTVDGDRDAVARVCKAVYPWTESVFRVGRPHYSGRMDNDHRLGVATNKNTGLELLMSTGAQHLFLSDDDSWPLSPAALNEHTEHSLAHSMVCWGSHRRARPYGGFASWSWPRGSVLYATRGVVETVGGMVEAFGSGGHEHVEWTRRIHNAGLTPALFPSPLRYAKNNFMGAAALWHCEDMAKPGEPLASLISRRRGLTSIRREPEDGDRINKLMLDLEGATEFVPYRAADNNRSSATLS